jgi:hypothetical protein
MQLICSLQAHLRDHSPTPTLSLKGQCDEFKPVYTMGNCPPTMDRRAVGSIGIHLLNEMSVALIDVRYIFPRGSAW